MIKAHRNGARTRANGAVDGVPSVQLRPETYTYALLELITRISGTDLACGRSNPSILSRGIAVSSFHDRAALYRRFRRDNSTNRVFGLFYLTHLGNAGSDKLF